MPMADIPGHGVSTRPTYMDFVRNIEAHVAGPVPESSSFTSDLKPDQPSSSIAIQMLGRFYTRIDHFAGELQNLDITLRCGIASRLSVPNKQPENISNISAETEDQEVTSGRAHLLTGPLALLLRSRQALDSTAAASTKQVMRAVLAIAVTACSVACAAPPSQSDNRAETPHSTLNTITESNEEALTRRGTGVSALWYDVPSPTPKSEPKKNIPGAIGATIAAVLIVTIAIVIFLAHRGIWLRHLRAQQTKSKTVLSFRPTSTTPEPIEYDEEMRQQRSGQIVQSYISMETYEHIDEKESLDPGSKTAQDRKSYLHIYLQN
ncbi:hypothetical protein Dda_1578 [Drechslerella dactyloides]|uniref:Uncharacterized protein n=1 Tax=Drechslerella dactyloides TaxID=74499 RepID=A0AAD6NM77_DREDA|nr:hypothetical protein Dda_1578 [Drechslerella dactyloides]